MRALNVTRRTLGILLASTALHGCSWFLPAPEQLTMPVLFEVKTADARPVTGAQLAAAGAAIGRSDRQGRLATTIRGAAGDRVPLQVNCPEGYRVATAPAALLVRTIVALHTTAPEPLRVPIVCEPHQRSVALVVRAEQQAGLPILARGKEVARTDESGLAHVLLTAREGEELTIELSTSHDPRLLPHSPRRQLTVTNRDELMIVDEKFTLKPEPQPRRRAAPRAAAQHVPYAL